MNAKTIYCLLLSGWVCAGVSASPTVVKLVDAVMDPESYDIVETPGTTMFYSVELDPDFGNPSPSMMWSIAGNSIDFFEVFATNPAFTHNPSEQGAISELRVSMDSMTSRYPGQDWILEQAGYSVVALQDGYYYRVVVDTSNQLDQWVPFSLDGVQAHDFDAVDFPETGEGPGLDFGPSGSKIVFGFRIGWSWGGTDQGLGVIRRIDNFELELLLVDEIPQLRILSEGETRLLVWPASFLDWSLEDTVDLADPTGWSPSVITPELVDGEFRAAMSVDGSRRFYRLRKDD